MQPKLKQLDGNYVEVFKMKKVTAFIGSARKKATNQAVQEFEKDLKKYGEIDFEYVFLHDHNLEFCRGCLTCLSYGEELCPLHDDRDILLEKMAHSDGVIFASPTYAFQVSARMKNFLDRLAFIYHRPRFFGKIYTAIVTQGFMGGKDAQKYLEDIGQTFGFTVAKGCCLMTLDPMTENQQKKLIEVINQTAARFYKELMHTSAPSPSLYRLMMYRMARTYIKSLDQKYCDYHYWKDNGWFESDYYYVANLGPIKKILGHFFDFLGRQRVKNG